MTTPLPVRLLRRLRIKLTTICTCIEVRIAQVEVWLLQREWERRPSRPREEPKLAEDDGPDWPDKPV